MYIYIIKQFTSHLLYSSLIVSYIRAIKKITKFPQIHYPFINSTRINQQALRHRQKKKPC